MNTQQQYQVDAARRRDMQTYAQQQSLAAQCQRKTTTQSAFTVVMQWMTNQLYQNRAEQTPSKRQIVIRSA